MNAEMQQVLGKIDELVSKKGFVYAMIMAQIEDESIPVANIDKRNSQKRLSSNEILFLWSLLINKDDFWHYPDSVDELYVMRCDIERVMEELHFTFFTGLITHLRDTVGTSPEVFKPYYDGNALHEAIFYSGGALYDEEYIYYIKTRYADDSQWLFDNKQYRAEAFCDIVNKIKETIRKKIQRFRFLSLPETFEERLKYKPSDMSDGEYKKELVLGQFLYGQDDTPSLEEFCNRLRDAISFTKGDLTECTDIDNYFKLFSIIPSKDCNRDCKEPGDYSILMSSPIIESSDGRFLLTEIHQMFKSLYDVPRYWLNEQLDEHGIIGSHVGDFSERQTLKVLKNIFGDNCYSDIIVYKGKQQQTDIDVLCIWKDYAICFQIKSKGLTLAAHQGCIAAIEGDFKKCFQAAYAQGKKCRDALLRKTGYSFVDKKSGQKIQFPSLREVYIVCETSDEYPSLTHQMTLLLQRKETEPAALAINLFDIDVMGKYLTEPYYFVHYIHNRLKFSDFIRTDEETNCLYAYTTNRLNLNNGRYNLFMFDNSFAKAIDAELLPKYEKHEEVTVNNDIWRDVTFDALLKEIDSSNQNGVSEIILKLMNFSRGDVKQIGQTINEHVQKGLAGIQAYYSFTNGEFGFTFDIMEMSAPRIVLDYIKALSVKELKAHNAQSWLTIVHFLGADSLVGTFAYIL